MIQVWEIADLVKADERTESDLLFCGCNQCLEALHRLRGED